MIGQDELWARVQRALDRRRDPLEDAQVRAALARDPELRGEVERLVERLGQLGSAPARRRPAAALTGLALAAAAALGFVLTLIDRSPSSPAAEAPLAERSERQPSRVLSLRMTSERRDADGRVLERRELADRQLSKTVQLRPRTADAPRTRNVATLVAWTETETRP
jgi:hypothetical protein